MLHKTATVGHDSVVSHVACVQLGGSSAGLGQVPSSASSSAGQLGAGCRRVASLMPGSY